MAQYKVTMVLEVVDGHPRKWLADAICENLNEGEDILELEIETLDDDAE